MRAPSRLWAGAWACRRCFAAATSLSSSPYVKRRPESEWTMAVVEASWVLMASKTGRRGSVEAILAVVRVGIKREGDEDKDEDEDDERGRRRLQLK